MNQLPFPRQVEVVSLLTEGNSIRATERLTRVHRDTIMRLSKRVGEHCHRLHDAMMLQLQGGFLELDETWSFVRKKQQHLQDNDPDEFGDTYLWLALDAQTKLIVSYLVGKRTGENPGRCWPISVPGSSIGPRSRPMRSMSMKRRWPAPSAATWTMR